MVAKGEVTDTKDKTVMTMTWSGIGLSQQTILLNAAKEVQPQRALVNQCLMFPAPIWSSQEFKPSKVNHNSSAVAQGMGQLAQARKNQAVGPYFHFRRHKLNDPYPHSGFRLRKGSYLHNSAIKLLQSVNYMAFTTYNRAEIGKRKGKTKRRFQMKLPEASVLSLAYIRGRRCLHMYSDHLSFYRLV